MTIIPVNMAPIYVKNVDIKRITLVHIRKYPSANNETDFWVKKN